MTAVRMVPVLASWILLAHFILADDARPYAPPAPSTEIGELKLDWRDAGRSREVPVKIY